MSSAPAIPVTSGTLQVPDERLHYEVRGSGPVIAIIGAPMDGTFFVPLAELMAVDHTVVTADPRGIKRSTLNDPASDSTPEMRADDLSRILAHVGGGPAAVVGSSGGAITSLALAIAHPEQVHTVVAHEPPLEDLLGTRLGDLDERRTALEDIVATHLSGDTGGAWGRFMAHAGFFPPEGAEAPAPPADQGPPDPQDIADGNYMLEHMLRGIALWHADLDALRSGPTRIVVGIGDTSAGQLCDHTSHALADELCTTPERFPGGHGGFIEDPPGFAARLREVLAQG